MMKRQLTEAILQKEGNLKRLYSINSVLPGFDAKAGYMILIKQNMVPKDLASWDFISVRGLMTWKKRPENASTWYKDSGVAPDDLDSYNDDPTKRNMVL